jgi:hypothetical protein
MRDKIMLYDNEEIILSEIPKKPNYITNEGYVKIVIPEKYINYEMGIFKIKEFIKSLKNDGVEFEYERKRV